MATKPPIYGLLAEFEDPNALLRAARAARQAGYRKMDAFTPFPVEGLAEALDFRHSRVPLVIFLGGLVGCVGGFLMQYWCAAISYPVNGGRPPLKSSPPFIPVSFELPVRVPALASVVGMLALNGLPMPYHPVFNVPRFARATRDRFFLCIEAADPQFDREATRQFLAGLQPGEVSEV